MRKEKRRLKRKEKGNTCGIRKMMGRARENIFGVQQRPKKKKKKKMKFNKI